MLKSGILPLSKIFFAFRLFTLLLPSADNKKIFQPQVVNDMLKEGTLPTADNFKNILFSDKGLIIYFERYQIAPYYYGDYSITIPYKYINLKK